MYLVDNNALDIKKTKAELSQLRTNIKVIGSNTSAPKALNEILQLKPDLVVSDLRMEQMGGIGLMSELKAAGADCEFVILSQSWSAAAIRDFFESGGFDFHLKPLDAQCIEEVLERLNAEKCR